jgi:hypothetical protein
MSTLKKALVSGILTAVLAVGFASVFGLEQLRSASATSGVTGGVGLYELGGALSSVADPSAYSYVIGDSSVSGQLASLPGTSLAYFAGTDVNTEWSTGVPYSQAAANGWLLRDASGNLLVNQAYAGDYVGDVGNPAYQQAWISNVLGYLAANPGIKGVFIDDVLYDLTPLAGEEAAKYPTQQSWAQATLSFVQAVGTALRAKGYYVLVNASGYVPGDSNSDDGTNTITWWQELGPYVNGLMNVPTRRAASPLHSEAPTSNSRVRWSTRSACHP